MDALAFAAYRSPTACHLAGELDVSPTASTVPCARQTVPQWLLLDGLPKGGAHGGATGSSMG